MKKFSDLNIKIRIKSFEGTKIKICKILNKEIIVYRFKIENSKIYKDRGNGKCLHLEISINGEKHIVFTSSVGLIDAILQINESDFPFITTIIEENERFKFS